MATNNNDKPADPSRRNLLKGASLVGAAVAGSTAGVLAAQDNPVAPVPPQAREALEVLTAAEAETLDAMIDRILPSDENGPGAREARAVHYIDRSLAADNAASRADYSVGLAVLDEYSRRQHGQRFHLLSAQTRDEVLQAVIDGGVQGFSPSGSGFFSMVRNHTIDGTFSDPYYGGNRDFVGWDMLRYPGVRVLVTEDEVAQGSSLAPNHQSAYDLPNFTKLIASNGGSRNGN